MITQKIILASKSPRRRQLLEWAEIPFEVIVSETDENFPEHLLPAEVAIHIATNKAMAIKKNIENLHTNGNAHTILAADTIVVLHNAVINKPKDRDDAIKILQSLSGKQHEVITGVVLLQEEKEIRFAVVTQVEFHELTNEQIIFSVDKSKP